MVGKFTLGTRARRSRAAEPERNGPSRGASYPTHGSEAPQEEIRNQPCFYLKLSGFYLFKAPTVPFNFLQTNGIDTDRTLKLWGLGSSWAVKLTNYIHHRKARLHGAWTRFALDNRWQVGYTLKFELVNMHNTEFVVTVINNHGQIVSGLF